MCRATVSGEPKASVSATSFSHVTPENRSAMARNPACKLGCVSSMRSGMMKRRSESWYHNAAEPRDIDHARAALALIESRGFHRRRDLSAQLTELLRGRTCG
jgi:hypothetical protein